MVKQKKLMCITQSGKNYAINRAIQGVRLIWKQKLWSAICKFLWSLTNQNAWFVSSFCTELTLFCTLFERNCTALNQSKWRNFFMYIIMQKIIIIFCKTEIIKLWRVYSYPVLIHHCVSYFWPCGFFDWVWIFFCVISLLFCFFAFCFLFFFFRQNQNLEQSGEISLFKLEGKLIILWIFYIIMRQGSILRVNTI